MTIGALAKAAGVGVETVRFYQRKGLIETPNKAAGIRKYSDSHVRIIRFVKRVQELGFTLKDAADLLEIEDCCDETRPRLAEVCESKIGEIRQKIADLNQMVELLHQFSDTCASDSQADSHCRLLDCFENDWACCEKPQPGEQK
ncbi:MAG: MerR family transcriptional regulator [Planctomycetota bacterium]